MTPLEQLERKLREENGTIVALLAMNKLSLAMDIIKAAFLEFELDILKEKNVYIVLENGKVRSVFRSKEKALADIAEMRKYNEAGYSYSLLTEELCD